MNILKKPTCEPRKLRPVILTCDQRLNKFRKFIESYKTVAHAMLPPVVLAGFYDPNKREEYNTLIQELNPYVVIEQPNYIGDDSVNIDLSKMLWKMKRKKLRNKNPRYYNIQKIMVKDFPRMALEYSKEGEDIVFIEDDIVFSSQFPDAIEKVNRHLQSDSDLTTLYFPKKGWPTKKSLPSNNFVHAISGYGYYMATCMALSRKTVEAFRDNWEEIELLSTAWDLRWAIYAENNGFRMYCTRVCYVNHQQGRSVMDESSNTKKCSHTKGFVK